MTLIYQQRVARIIIYNLLLILLSYEHANDASRENYHYLGGKHKSAA